MTTFTETLNNISRSLHPNSAKVQAIKIMAISKLNFYFPNISFPEKVLKELEDQIVDKIRTWFGLNNSTTRSFIFTSKQCGGLGIPKPRDIYYADRLSFVLSVLNSSDNTVRRVARESLQLHMTRRKIPLAEPGESSFGGFRVVGNKLDKTTTSNWPKSFWVNIFEMCHREGISLQVRGDLYRFVASDDDEVEFVIESHEGFKLFYKEKCNLKSLGCWKDLVSQGRYIRETTNYDIDVKLFMHVFDNHNVEDKR